MRISDWSSDVCSSDLPRGSGPVRDRRHRRGGLGGDGPPGPEETHLAPRSLRDGRVVGGELGPGPFYGGDGCDSKAFGWLRACWRSLWQAAVPDGLGGTRSHSALQADPLAFMGAIAPAPPGDDSPRPAAVDSDWSRRAAVPAAGRTACTTAKGGPAPGRTAGRAKRCPRLTQTREARSPRPHRRSLAPSPSLTPPLPSSEAGPPVGRHKAVSCGGDGEDSAPRAGTPPPRAARARPAPAQSGRAPGRERGGQ